MMRPVLLAAVVAVSACGGETTGTHVYVDVSGGDGDAATDAAGGGSPGLVEAGSGGSVGPDVDARPARRDAAPEAGPLQTADGGPCSGTAGPSMVRIPALDGTTYCMDSTEVTNSQYAMFLDATRTDAGTNARGQDPWCAWNVAYPPDETQCAAHFDPYARPSYPVVCIDWCDAAAYCRWAGKRLCGKIGGGSMPYSVVAPPELVAESQWYNACSGGGTRTYSSGGSYVPTACNGSGSGTGHTLPVPAMPATCEGGYAGLFDLSGNVFEWEDGCDAETGETDLCPVRGGSADSSWLGLECETSANLGRSSVESGIGLRCCSE